MRPFAVVAAFSGFLAVLAGAFGAHALSGRVEPDLLAAFETATRYQMYHALALFVAAWFRGQGDHHWATRAAWAFVVGTVLFSGSLYALALTGIRELGVITPFGGLAFLAGWLMLGLAARHPMFTRP